MLGGDDEIAKSLEPDTDQPLALRFQPEDLASRAVTSYNKKTHNLLLKVTVPKRTGRKRKRGSNNDFTNESTEPSARKDVRYLLRSMKDNPRRYEAEIIGPVHPTHVWRTMPDFVYSSKGSMFLDEVKTKILPQDYPHLKQWSLPRASASASTDTEAIPPAVFSTLALPYNYTYFQDTSVKNLAGKRASRDTKAPVGAAINPNPNVDGGDDGEGPVPAATEDTHP